MDYVLDILDEHASLFSGEFMDWLPDNLHVWDAFCQEAFAVRQAGYTHYSARTIIHFLRHHSAVAEKNGEWKINNNHSPYLARLFDLRFPHAAGLWQYRETKKVLRG